MIDVFHFVLGKGNTSSENKTNDCYRQTSHHIIQKCKNGDYKTPESKWKKLLIGSILDKEIKQ